MDEFQKLYNKALRFLSFRPRSEKEVRDNLIKTLKRKRNNKPATTETQKRQEAQNDFSVSDEFSDSVVARKALIIDQVIAKLKEQKFLNDEEFTKWWIEQRTTFRPKGIRLIKIELQRKGVAREIVDNIVENSELKVENDLDKAKKLVQKKLPRYQNLPRQEQYQKLGAFLARQGFDWETIKEGIDDVLKERV